MFSPLLDALSRAVLIRLHDGSSDDMARSCINLEIVDLDVEDNVGGMVDGEVGDTEALE